MIDDRDLVVFILAVLSSILIGAIDTIIHLDPELSDGAVSATLLLGVSLVFYRLGKG